MQVTSLESALKLATVGFSIFPLWPNSKLPAIKNFSEKATTNPAQIQEWWKKNPNYGIGISTDNLIGIDVDVKNGKNGHEEIEKLKKEGFVLPETFTQVTPTSGSHLIYKTEKPVRSGVDVIGRGIDVRGRGGYLVGAGSRIDGKLYTASGSRVEWAPEWLVSRLRSATQRKPPKKPVDLRVDQVRAESRSVSYLRDSAPLAVEGNGGDQTTFIVSCRVKDLGVDENRCFDLLLDHWNERCEPPWNEDDLRKKVENAYRHGSNPQGIDAPETQFDPIDPDEIFKEEPKKPKNHIEQLNQTYSYIAGNKGFIVHEKDDDEGNPCIEVIAVPTFHQNLAALKVPNADGRLISLTKKWIAHPDRRTFDGMCFFPEAKPRSNYYNIWRGFKVKAHTDTTYQASIDAFLEHAKLNICSGDEKLYHWLIGYFAHLVQKPWELPMVALVFRGGKGVGKNALVERIAYLLGAHASVEANRRHFLGNFNSSLENKLMLILDEAFWSGDKPSEGQLKHLITGTHHSIERKGFETYKVKNCLRVVILGNEDWIVPASEDERRYAVFDVGDGRKQDRKFFKDMREGMEKGGYGLLLHYLKTYDFSGVEVGLAPFTLGLAQQKENSLSPIYQWWLDNLSSGMISRSDLGSEWLTEVSKDRFRQAFHRYCTERRISTRMPGDTTMGKLIRRVCPSMGVDIRKRDEGERRRFYKFPSLSVCRSEWETFIGHKMTWEEDEQITEDLFS